MIQKNIITPMLLAWGCLSAASAHGEMLTDFAQKTVLKNPDVLSRWHSFKSAVDETDVARGVYFPRVDLTVGSGREHNGSPVALSNYSVNRKTATLTLTQTLYDGFATRDEVRRLTNTQLIRYYELLDVSETAVLEAVRAYYDVLRQRRLYALTEDNYVSHRTVFEQIQQKVQAGVGRRVDLEQAAGRLALSESNLVLDNANVHDVSARFQRVTGELPPMDLASPPSLGKLIFPKAADAHLAVAVDSHPAILAAVENVRAAHHDLGGRWSKYQPKLDFRLSQTRDKNAGGIAGKQQNTVAEFVLNWNLFNGGSDSARVDQYVSRLDAARDQRDKVCRDMRQNLAIAYNDVWKLHEQLGYLEQHQLSIEKARGAYQKQFEIGQRTLLDLLDTENELYQARRSYINAEYDLAIAHARTLAGMGRLVSSLGLRRPETEDLPELLGVSADAPEGCPPEAPLALDIRKAELDARAIAAAKPPELPAVNSPPPAGAAVPPAAPEPPVVKPAAPALPKHEEPEPPKPTSSIEAPATTAETAKQPLPAAPEVHAPQAGVPAAPAEIVKQPEQQKGKAEETPVAAEETAKQPVPAVPEAHAHQVEAPAVALSARPVPEVSSIPQDETPTVVVTAVALPMPEISSVPLADAGSKAALP